MQEICRRWRDPRSLCTSPLEATTHFAIASGCSGGEVELLCSETSHALSLFGLSSFGCWVLHDGNAHRANRSHDLELSARGPSTVVTALSDVHWQAAIRVCVAGTQGASSVPALHCIAMVKRPR